jgi:CRISPR-associated endonuclease/helicase Cas3
MEFKHLLAKSTKTPDTPEYGATLVGHTSQVLEAADVLESYLLQSIQDFLPKEITSEMWSDALFCAAWLHDIGKANDHFQTILRDRNFRQGVRHESLGIIVIETLLEDWLHDFWQKYPEWFKPAILFSISGHHLKFPDNRQRSGVLKSEVIFLGEHPQLQDVLEFGRKRLQLPSNPSLTNQQYSLIAFGEMEIKDQLRKVIRRYDFQFSENQKKIIAMLKSTLMCADLAGSALPAKQLNIKEWLTKRLKILFTAKELEGVIEQKLRGGSLKKFQCQIAQADCKTILVEAGCGAGKTLAAYKWATKTAVNKRLFFCYPTTATASEGFSSYLYDPGFEALLVHSRVNIDYRLLENMPRRSATQRELRHLGLEAIDTWPAAAVVCTAHTVLGLLQNTRRGIYAWPSLVRGVFIFDEIHAFSDLLFAHLLRFLGLFDHTPVLLMTATLPSHRKKALEKACELRGGIKVVTGPQEREQAKRYLLSRSSEQVVWDRCKETIAAGGKVLWICNTISRAMTVAREAYSWGLPVQPYHSRYRYKDRLNRQRTVIDGFLPNKSAMLAVTTQVAEISLDLSADLLITEYAPVPALIQRLGRLNRFADQPEYPAPALFLKPENGLPYAKTDEEKSLLWQQIDAWLDLVADRQPKSQQDLFHAFLAGEGVSNDTFDDPYCDWLDDPWKSQTNKHSLMEPGYTVDMIREEDLQIGKLAEMAIPMPIPRSKDWAWRNEGKYIIAPAGAIQYDPFWGGEYAKQFNFEII